MRQYWRDDFETWTWTLQAIDLLESQPSSVSELERAESWLRSVLGDVKDQSNFLNNLNCVKAKHLEEQTSWNFEETVIRIYCQSQIAELDLLETVNVTH